MPHQGSLSNEQKVTMLMEEYRALYTLALFRLQALDRRVPLAVGALGAFLVAVTTLPWHAQVVALAGVPASLVWVMRTTISHARSFEDCLRRIEEIEQHSNALAGESLLGFQSHHPSRGRATGGRSGNETVIAVLLAGGLTLGATAWLALRTQPQPHFLVALAYVAAIGLYLLWAAVMHRRYRYRPAPNATDCANQ